MESKKGKWLPSKEALKHLKITNCELMQRRERSELKFEKRSV